MGFVFSIGIILLLGFVIGLLLDKIRIPGLVGMVIVGLLIGPHVLGLIDSSVLNISSELRQIALVIILTRSGLNLNIKDLKEIGRPAILMSFIPATFEIIGVTIGAFFLLKLNIVESILLGTVLAAVSPAVVSPRMIKLIENKYGNKNHVPEIVLAGSSVDDIYVIVLFYATLGVLTNNSIDALSIAMIPISIILGIIFGIGVGFLLSFIINKVKLNTVSNVIITLATSFLMIGIENILKPYIKISSLLGIMVMAMIILFRTKEKAKDLSNGYNKLWKVFEIILFVLVGASLDFKTITSSALWGLVVLFIGLVFRTFGVYLCLLGTKLNKKERIFVMISYLPKATVQASIGGIALSMGLDCGGIVLAIAVLSICITAPIGALLIDNLSSHLLNKDEEIVI